MKFYGLIFENNIDRIKETLAEMKNKVKDVFNAHNIDPASFYTDGKTDIEGKFKDKQNIYTISLNLLGTYFNFDLHAQDQTNFSSHFTTHGDIKFNEEEDLLEKLENLIENFIKSTKDKTWKRQEIEKKFDEFFENIQRKFSQKFVFSKDPYRTYSLNDDFDLARKISLYNDTQYVGELSLSYQEDSNFSSPKIFLKILDTKQTYESFEELMTSGQSFVIELLSKQTRDNGV